MTEVSTKLYHWPEWRLRYLLQRGFDPAQRNLLALVKQVSFVPMDAVGKNGGIKSDVVCEKELVEKGYTLFFEGDVIVAKITPCFENYKGALAIGLHAGIAYGTTELHVLSPGKRLDGRFLFYLSISHPFRIQGEAAMKGAAGQKRVPDGFIKNFRLLLPPLSIQNRISDFLDVETEQIDTLVTEKEHMLSLIEEKRSALISHVVTRGLNPNAPLQKSGYSWLGEIPSHWDVKRSKRLLRERDERSITGEEELLTVSHITGVTKRSEKDVNMFEAKSNEGYKKCYSGDLVINTLWAWMGAMGVAWENGIVSPAYHVYELGEELLPEYVDALVRIPVFAKEVTRFSKGVWSSRLRLYPEGLYEVWLPVPPINEQKEIITSIAHERKQTAELESELKKSIILLKERRSALITAAVTGQLEPEEMNI